MQRCEMCLSTSVICLFHLADIVCFLQLVSLYMIFQANQECCHTESSNAISLHDSRMQGSWWLAWVFWRSLSVLTYHTNVIVYLLKKLLNTSFPCACLSAQLQKEFRGCQYEKNRVELMLSALDFHEDYLTFLKNSKEDLSSMFCSELVAHAYHELGLLG